LVRNNKVCDIPLGHDMIPKIFWSAFPWRKGSIVGKARFASLQDCQGSRRFANRWLMRTGSPILRSTLILLGDWCSGEVTDARTQGNYGNDAETLNQRAGSITARWLSRESPLHRRDFSLDRVPFHG